MSELNEQLVASSRLLIGSRFRNHYLPNNRCDLGARTNPDCMRRGLKPGKGLDCSGLVIASMSQALGIEAADWPRDMRHVVQMARLAKVGAGEVGDIPLLRYNKTYGSFTHIGIRTSPNTGVHSTDVGGRVVEDAMWLDECRMHIPAGLLAETVTELMRE